MEQGIFIDFALHLSVAKQSLNLAGKEKAARLDGVVKRLDPDAVPNQPQKTEVRVPERERKHSTEPMNRIGAPLAVRVNNYLAVRAGGMKAMTQAFEFAPK